MSKILTVVVPVYNTEKYLAKCLESLIAEKLIDNIEAIVVIDGSKDNSIKIALDFQNKHPDIFKVINKENGGHGSCCNIGLEMAQGKYIRFLDSDDWFDAHGFPAFVELLNSIDADLVQCNRVIEFSDKNEPVKERFYDEVANKIWDVNTFPFGITEYPNLIHNSTFKTDVLRLSGIHFSEKISFDDTALYIKPYKAIKTIYCSNLHVYHYLIGREGQSVTGLDMKKMEFREHEFRKLSNDYLSIRDGLSEKQVKYFDKFMNDTIYMEFYRCAFLLSKKETSMLITRFNDFIKSISYTNKKRVFYTSILVKIPHLISKKIILFEWKLKKNTAKHKKPKCLKALSNIV